MKYEKSAAVCRAALRAGQLEMCRFGNLIAWKFGQRIFSASVVASLIDSGEAERIGNIVREIV